MGNWDGVMKEWQRLNVVYTILSVITIRMNELARAADVSVHNSLIDSFALGLLENFKKNSMKMF